MVTTGSTMGFGAECRWDSGMGGSSGRSKKSYRSWGDGQVEKGLNPGTLKIEGFLHTW